AADVVISIGHQSRAEDEAMAQAVPGIDLILGTHSHLKVPLTQIEGTATYYISPFQYLGYVSHVTLHVAGGELTEVTGELVAIDETTPEDALLTAKVTEMQDALEEEHPERFEILGEAATLIDNTDINLGETGIGNFVTDLARQAVDAHLFLSTSSSFRAALPPGPITREDYLTALPYANTIVTATMQGSQLLDLVALSASKRGSDAFSQMSGVRYTLTVSDSTVSDVQVISDPADPTSDYVALDPDATYTVATTNFQALIAADYKERFAEATDLVNTEININDLVVDYIQNNSPISATVDGRVQVY
ncbi:MAG: 5'-nucleotidase C-terminal domain-containing protein, partial [Caldilineaceae bacterium]|nr:5'-nucleotidase C-terminal domain-containing protein [Caldilineaceae bacterium]